MNTQNRLALLAFALAACDSRGSLVVVDVEASPALVGVAHVRATVDALGASRDFDLPSLATVATPFTFGIDLPPTASGSISLHVVCSDTNDAQLGAGDGAATLGPGDITAVTVSIVGAHADGGADLAVLDLEAPRDLAAGFDLAARDLSTVDLVAPRDLSTPDLAPPPDMATCVLASGATAYVDPTLGSNDTQHGGGPGACAYRTITYALAHARATINLKSTGTYQNAETFPLVLTGAQALDGDPTATGTQAHIIGLGNSGAVYGVVFLSGAANQLRNCDVSAVGAAPGNINACVEITTSGAHVVDRSTLHDCGAGVYSIGVNGNNASGATVSNSAITNVQNCTNSLGANWTINATTCSAIGYYVSICGSNLVGCGDSNAAGGLGLCTSCTCPATFTAACP